jgi:hypothetical protein
MIFYCVGAYAGGFGFCGNGGGATSFSLITGNASGNTSLMSLLTGSYVPYTGATTDLNLGNHKASIGGGGIATRLTVYDTTSSSPRGLQSRQISSDVSGARIGLSKARGTFNNMSSVHTADTVGRIPFWTYDGTNYLEMASVDVGVSGTVASTRTPTYMAFQTATDAAPSVLTERMRIDNAGNVGIGTTGPGTKLDVVGGIRSSFGIVVNNTVDSVAPADGQIKLYATNNKFRFTYPSVADVDLSVGGAGQFSIGGGTSLYLNSGNVGIATASPVSKLHIGAAPTATANYGTVSIGGGPFDGLTTGKFVGSSSGTSLAVNEVSGYAGDVLNLGVAGVKAIKVTAGGSVSLGVSTAAVNSTPSAIPITSTNCEVSTTGVAVATLANGSTVGQILNIYVKAVSIGTDTLVITPTTLLGGTAITFAASPLGHGISLVWTASGWCVVGQSAGVTVA